MTNPLSTSDAPDLTDKSVKKVWIKNGARKMITDSGWMKLPAHHARRLFGEYKGGKYSMKQTYDSNA